MQMCLYKYLQMYRTDLRLSKKHRQGSLRFPLAATLRNFEITAMK